MKEYLSKSEKRALWLGFGIGFLFGVGALSGWILIMPSILGGF